MSRAGASPLEPSRERLENALIRWFLATRPAFLSITLAGCLLGFASAVADGAAAPGPLLLATVLLALLAHAAVNVLNDYCDHLNGADALNADRLYPYTGGSRFIQNGVLSPTQTRALAYVLFALVVVGGLGLMWEVGTGLFWIGLAGLALGWTYSAAPLKLNSRGLGEVAVAAGFALVVAGADYVLRGAGAPAPWRFAIPYACLVANILYLNQFPDYRADAAAGKRHWVVRLGPQRAVWGYVFFLGSAAVWTLCLWGLGYLSSLALLSLIGLAPGFRAALALYRHAETPSALRPAIQMTIAAAHLQALLLAATLVLEHAI